ncbi:hypothetical protein D3C72_2356920 [compost metagenome]
MRVAGHNRLHIVFGLFNQGFLQFMQESHELHHPVTEIQMHVCRYLVVAAASRVQLAANGTDFLDQILFNIHMNIFVRYGEFNLA